MATIAVRRARLQQQLEQAKAREAAADDKIAHWMGKRIDAQEHQAELLAALQSLDELQRNLPGGDK
jgi:predicted  nucleic acid-binding Zn-ribbon protein